MRKPNWSMKACGVFLLWATAAIALPAQTLTTIHSFDYTDGYFPIVELVQATSGDLYGTTNNGGASTACTTGCGTVFKITPSGTLVTLHSFAYTDGAFPAGLIQGADGNFYGTTYNGGANDNCFGNTCGTVFKITASGTLTTLYSFCPLSGCADGEYPLAGLVQASDGDLYGTTDEGGAYGFGSVFKITPGGTLTTLHSFDGADGANPYAALVQATNGNFYGTTGGGGANGDGTVFEITPSGTLTTLHSFGGTDGTDLEAGLVQGANGDFYGTTYAGGANGDGTVFRITPSGTLTTLHSFDSTDGASPYEGLIQATDGDLYGTTEGGGANRDGTVFKITPDGTLTTLYSFDETDGGDPYAALLQDTNGMFYGATVFGGANGEGTVFSLSVGLKPFVGVQPTSGPVGGTVKILGTNLTGATSVTFNGTAATFTVKSGSEITTTVPAGATTGTVQVKVSPRTLSSNVPFTVK